MDKTESNIIFHAEEAEKAAFFLDTSLQQGLSSSEAGERLKKHGKNAIVKKRERTWLNILLSQFKSPIVFLLLFAAALSIWFEEYLDAIAILCVLLINAAIGFYMESKAEKSMNALKKLAAAPAKVLRDGQMEEIESENIVPGDIIFVEAGDLVPADGRTFNISQLMTDESALTGESVPVEKHPSLLERDTTLAERTNMIYKGTHVSKGNAYAIVTGTGMKTELGKVASLVQSAKQAATPLEKKLEAFSKRLIQITVVLVVIIFVVGLAYGQPIIKLLTTCTALAVAAIPEGLPIVATLALAQGMIKMARHSVIVKKLSAVETLGGTNVICTDKTGTLTKNKIEVDKIVPVAENAEEIILLTFVLCNTSEIYSRGKELKELGDPLETGLLKYAAGKGIHANETRASHLKVKEEPFSSETKMMVTLHRKDKKLTAYAKGAVEEIVSHCNRIMKDSSPENFSDVEKKNWLDKGEQMAASGLKVIAFAYKEAASENEDLNNELVFTGLVGLVDPPREDVFGAIEECKSAGINIIMITGDHPSTAKKIARQLNIADDDNVPVILGKEMKDFDALSPEEKDHWAGSHVFARVSPKQKLDLVSVLQEKKLVVGMTGDGINDAPALKKSDIGIAMGERGTQVAQEVADMVLKDDSFASIVMAIKEGRIIFENIRKFVIFLLSCNLSELLVISVTAIFNFHFQLFPLQILFINLVTDVLPALALGITEGSDVIMKHKPRKMSEQIIDRKRWVAIFFYSAVISAASMGAVLWSHYTLHRTEGWNPALCNNILFFTLILSQLLHVFNMGASGVTLFRSEVTRNKYVWYSVIVSIGILIGAYFIVPLREVLSVERLSVADLLLCSACSVLSLIIIQVAKKLNWVRQ